MKNISLILTLISLTLISCKKEDLKDQLPEQRPIAIAEKVQFGKALVGNNVLILNDQLNLFAYPVIGPNKPDTMNYMSGGKRWFDFYDFRNEKVNEIKFTIYYAGGIVYTIEVLDTNIICGKKYNVVFNSMNPENQQMKFASNAVVTFTKYQYPGKVEGTFSSDWNNELWCKGSFDFTSYSNVNF